MSIQLELQVTTGKPIYRGHDHYWSVIRDLAKGGNFTRREVAQRSNDRDDYCIADFLKRLEKAEFVEVVSKEKQPNPHGGFFHFNVFRLLKRPIATPAIARDGTVGSQGLGQVNLWNAIRTLSGFNSPELAIAATTKTIEVQTATARRYCRHLQDAGYLQIVRSGGPGVPRIWRLKPSMNTGPRPPKILRCKAVYDTNKNKIMGTQIAEEVAA